MANDYGNRPWILDTAPYQTGTVGITQYGVTVTGTGTVWTATTHPSSPTTDNRDFVTQISVDSGVTWYDVASRDSNTQLTLLKQFAEATVAGASYLTRRLLLGSKKIASTRWVGATAGHTATIRDANYKIKITGTADATNQDEELLNVPVWVNGFALTALPSGVLYVYIE